jgi:hypothetical protein
VKLARIKKSAADNTHNTLDAFNHTAGQTSLDASTQDSSPLFTYEPSVLERVKVRTDG